MTGLPTIPVVDDQVRSLELLERILNENFEVSTAATRKGRSRSGVKRAAMATSFGYPTMDRDRALRLTEAARGSLGHWLKIDNGRMANYQIIGRPRGIYSRDLDGTPRPPEQALAGASVRPARPSRWRFSILSVPSIRISSARCTEAV
ncbi:MAG: nickel-dependent hydrogenase large subunit [Hoeflea sp.]|uniref:nickel-dependent hydrogenase large subunit n=1 Tax=Hoeflea sp. TaxID=1940281 RepID=UPI00329A2857